MDKLAGNREACLRDFNTFVITFTDEGFYEESIHKPLCRFLQFSKSKRKVIILPRGFLKTTIAIELYSLWKAILNPNIRCLNVSNSAPNAEKTVGNIRGIVEKSTLFQQMFPDVIPNFNRVRWSDRCAELVRTEHYGEGTFESAGTNTNIIRRHYNLILEDDTVAPKKDDLTGQEVLPGREMIEQAIGWHKLASPLLINQAEDEILVCGTRWCGYDLIQYVLQDSSYEVFEMAATKDGTLDGEPTYPKRFPRPVLNSLRTTLGPYMFPALYLNRPMAGEHMLFKPEWIRYIDESIEGTRYLVIDPAISTRLGADYTVEMVGTIAPGRIHIDDYIRARMTPNQLIDNAFMLVSKHNISTIIIETVQYQKSLVYSFKDVMAKKAKWLSIIEFNSRTAKEERIRGLQPLMEHGQVTFKRGLPLFLENEIVQFPYGAHDDCLDALSMLLCRFERSDEVRPVITEKRGFRITLQDVLDELSQSRSYYPYTPI